ncbi:TonB-dependent receptor plug domain-containing protein [Aureibacter tunicatorum]|uniref:Outer membrane receptor protein involved in Fe transport n=1 Tax=Aureibacter tunicatorum TaxID=866807 RepID=A0AAE4BNQ3_9BACT|nr:TonB-dependent receptor [Aureibacter tunicatorum]MDR6237084.1 outer membrane receptor protein involved in Fe transport [Aureibacter tunicatorum]BDD06076.1 TonB-dependent receptor [Aureibacter tunicatorum]
MNYIFRILASLLFVTMLNLNASAQSSKVMMHIMDEKKESLAGANAINKSNGDIQVSNADGMIMWESLDIGDTIVVSFIGFEEQSLVFGGKQEMHVMMKAGLGLDEVVVKGSTTYMDKLETSQVETITSSELKKAACCDLSESFETNASVDVGQSDAATGSKKIRFLGLSGKYTQLQVENIPSLRGLSAPYGLSYIPGTWVESIDVSKGAGSIENSYEAMTGQINVRLIQAENTEGLYFNLYGNSFGRMEANIHTSTNLNDKLSSSLLIHGDYMGNELEGNNDGFMDLPKSKNFNVLNRWKYKSDKFVSNWNFQVLTDEKVGGQLGYDKSMNHSSSDLYGIYSKTNKASFFGKSGFNDLFGNSDWQAAVFYNLDYTELESYYGRRDYDADQFSAFFNGFVIKKMNYGLDQLKVGVNYSFDQFDEQLGSLDSEGDYLYLDRVERVYGAYGEWTHSFNQKFSSVASARYDYNSLYGGQFIPRLHLKYNAAENTVLRANAGKGVRTPNPIAENTQVLVSSRDVVMNDLDQEVSWNFGTSLQQEFSMFGSSASFVMDYYYTFFENQLVVDMDTDASKVIFSNLDGDAGAHSFQAELAFSPLSDLSVKTAYKYYDVTTTFNGELEQVPLVAKHRYFLNLGYSLFQDKVKIDWTGNYIGSKRLPHTTENPEAYRLDDTSPSYFTMNAQISYAPKDKLEFYLGGENLTNYKQENPILSSEDPFGDNFDASMNWGPITGTMIYAGLRWRLLE